MTTRTPGGLHGVAIATMAVSALVGILALLVFVTVRWPSTTGSAIKLVFVLATIMFLTSAVAAVLAAARDTYLHDSEPD